MVLVTVKSKYGSGNWFKGKMAIFLSKMVENGVSVTGNSDFLVGPEQLVYKNIYFSFCEITRKPCRQGSRNIYIFLFN